MAVESGVLFDQGGQTGVSPCGDLGKEQTLANKPKGTKQPRFRTFVAETRVIAMPDTLTGSMFDNCGEADIERRARGILIDQQANSAFQTERKDPALLTVTADGYTFELWRFDGR